MRVDEVAEKQKHLPWYNEKRSEACQAQPLKDRSLAKTTWECARRGRCVSSPHSNLQERKHFQSEWWLVFSVYPSPLCLNIPVPCVSTLNGSRPVCFYLPHFCLHSLGGVWLSTPENWSPRHICMMQLFAHFPDCILVMQKFLPRHVLWIIISKY